MFGWWIVRPSTSRIPHTVGHSNRRHLDPQMRRKTSPHLPKSVMHPQFDFCCPIFQNP
jgi:hypothetical protein